MKPRNQRDGTTAKCFSFDDETQFEQNTPLLKRVLAAYGATCNY